MTSWRTVSLVLVLGWAASLALPVATFGLEAGETWSGWAVLLLGWLGFFLGQFAWIANLLFAAVIILLVRGRPPLVWGLMMGVLTSLLAVHALNWTSVYQTGGGLAPIVSFGLGYYLWIAATFAAGAALCFAALAQARPSGASARTA